MNFVLACERIKTLAEDLKSAKELGEDEAFKQDLTFFRSILMEMSRELKESREDSAFFGGELDCNIGENKMLHAVDAYRERRRKRRDCRAVSRYRERKEKRLDKKKTLCSEKCEDSGVDKDQRFKREDLVDRFKESRKNRLDERIDADDEEGQWVTTKDGNHLFIDGEGNPTKGNPYVVAAANGETVAESEPHMSKRSLNTEIDRIIKSGGDPEKRKDEVKKVLKKLRNGSKITMPDSWAEEDGTIPSYILVDGYWEDNKGWGRLDEDEMSWYFVDDDENERPKITRVARSEESREESRKKRESKKNYAINPNGSIDGKYTSDFHNDHVSQQEREEFRDRIKEKALAERGFDEERALYRHEANAVGDHVVEEIKRRAALRKGDTENAPIDNKPQVEDIYDVLRDCRDFGMPDGFNPKVTSDLDEERTKALIKEATDRFPTDWYKGCTFAPDIEIKNEAGRSYFGGNYIVVYAKDAIGEGKVIDDNDRGIVNKLAHELGHFMEEANEKVGYSARDCLWKRGKDSELVDVEPGYKGYKDSFFHTYMGKIYPYGNYTEIISVLMQNIGVFSPFEVLQGKEYDVMSRKYGRKVNDKESLRYILGVLAGL